MTTLKCECVPDHLELRFTSGASSMTPRDTCVVLVTNRSHVQRCFLTIWQLRWFGKYRGDIVIVVGDDLKAAVPAMARSALKVRPVFFPELDRSEAIKRLKSAPNTSEVVFTKPFQFHKVHIFDTFFTQWKSVLYVDTKMRVFNPIHPLLNLDCDDSLIAHSDAYPDYTRTLESQFNTQDFPELAEEADQLVPLDSDYFQTGMMLFDTAIISQATVQEIAELSQKFINSNSNEQGIINLWAQSRNLWVKLPTSASEGKLLYDYWERAPHTPADYLLLKYPREMREGIFRRIVNKLFHTYWFLLARRIDRTLLAKSA